MATQQLILLNDKGLPTIELLDILNDKSVMNRYKNIIAYFKDNNFEIDATDLKNLITHVDDSVYKQVLHYAHLLYHSMEQNNSWGDPGEQQVKVSFFAETCYS